MQTINLDSTKIKQVANASRTATATMILLGFRQRAHNFINLQAVKRELEGMNEHVVDKDYMDFWRGLEDAGVGSIIVGRRGKQTRFEWNYSLKHVAQVAIEGKKPEFDKIINKQNQFTKVKTIEIEKPQMMKAGPVKRGRGRPKGSKNVKVAVSKQEMVTYEIPIRTNFIAYVSLPSNLSKQELAKVKKGLQIRSK